MRLVILDDAGKAGEWAAKYVKKRINDSKPGPDNYFVLGLPTGKESIHTRDIQETKFCSCAKSLSQHG